MIPWSDKTTTAAHFHDRHEERYGHRLDLAVEIVNLRVSLRGPQGQLSLHTPAQQQSVDSPATADMFGMDQPVPIYKRETITLGQLISGPALITEMVSTTLIAAGWQAQLHESGSLLLQKQA
jgi:N-methylhydantoinase A